jgi:hypothetical protein
MEEVTPETTTTTTTTTTTSDRTKAERQAQVRPILEKLTELKLHASKFAAVKALMLQIQDYVKNGEPQKVNIVFPEFGRRIKGTLETNRHVESSVKFQKTYGFQGTSRAEPLCPNLSLNNEIKP